MYLEAKLRCNGCNCQWDAWGYDFVLDDLCPNCGSPLHSFLHMWRYDEKGGPLIEESAYDGYGRELWTTLKK
jgi:predicted amidophosphoribosyltransferase